TSAFLDSPPSNAVPVTVNATATQTSVTLATTPTGSVAAGTAVKLTATVSPSTAAGAVQFLDGSAAIGTPVTVNAGTATFTDSGFHVGSHSLTALFSPASSA